jgi:transcription antitermination factor NusG
MELELDTSAKEFTGATYLPWFALQVRSCKESWTASYLTGQGYECFLPKYKSTRQWSDRKKDVELALFPGYLFCRFDPLLRLPILKTPGVIQVVGYNREPTPIGEDEIYSIQRMIASKLPVQPWPFLEMGDRVRIKAGSLRGLEGILVSVRGKNRLVLSVALLQRSVCVQMDSIHVEPCKGTSLGKHTSNTMPPHGELALVP